jgi:hypothetical protein
MIDRVTHQVFSGGLGRAELGAAVANAAGQPQLTTDEPGLKTQVRPSVPVRLVTVAGQRNQQVLVEFHPDAVVRR